jgi:transposase InsO family protein
VATRTTAADSDSRAAVGGGGDRGARAWGLVDVSAAEGRLLHAQAAVGGGEEADVEAGSIRGGDAETTVRSFFGIIQRRVAAVVDAYTRAVIATGVYPTEPTAESICSLLSRAIRDATTKPVHLISDHGPQFTSLAFKRLLRRRGIRHRYGAIGKSGSIALIERFWRSLKREALEATSSWLTPRALAGKVSRYAAWFSEFRPHQGLQGRTPLDVSTEERKRAKPTAIVKGDVLLVTRRDLHDDPRLPVYSLRVRRAG